MTATLQRPNPFDVHPRAAGLSAIRSLPSGAMRQYSAIEFPNDLWGGCEHLIRTAANLGLLVPSRPEPSYAVLDVLDENGEEIQTYDILTAEGFQYIKRRLHLRVVA